MTVDEVLFRDHFPRRGALLFPARGVRRLWEAGGSIEGSRVPRSVMQPALSAVSAEAVAEGLEAPPELPKSSRMVHARGPVATLRTFA